MKTPSGERLLGLSSRLIWLAIMAAGPAVFFPEAMSPFAPPKRDVFYSLALIQFALLILRHLPDPGLGKANPWAALRGFARKLAGNPAVWPLTACVIVVGVRIHGDADSRTALAPLLDVTVAGSLALGLLAERDAGLAWKMMLAYAAGAAGSGIYGLFQFAGWDPFSWQSGFAGGAPGATYGNPLFLASGLAAALPPAILSALGRTGPPRILSWIVAATALAALVPTQARGAWIGAAAGVVAALGWAFARRRVDHRGLAGLLALSALLAAVVAFLSFPNPLNRRELAVARHAATAFNPFRDEYRGRLLLWHATALMVRDRPLIGWGLGQLRVRYTDYQGRLLATAGFRGIPYHSTAHAHQDALQIAAERGLLGLGLFAWFLAAVFSTLRRRAAVSAGAASVAAGCVLLAWLVDGLFNGPLNLPPSAYLFWLFAALACRPKAPEEETYVTDEPVPDVTLGDTGDAERVAQTPTAGRVALAMLVLLFMLRPFARDLASEGYLFVGNRALERGDAALALPYCLRAWALSYEDRRHHFYLGEAYYNQGMYREAEEEFSRDLRVNPAYHSGWHNLGLARYARGMKEPALEAFIRALEIDPADRETARMILKLRKALKPAIDRSGNRR